MSAPELLGIVNLTEDSFSDGGLHLDPGKAIDHALRLLDDGADAIDLGPSSSHPDAVAISAGEEILRLAPVVTELARRDVVISVDSCQLDTQRWALAQGVAMLNDIGGFSEPALYRELADADCRLVLMHSVQRGPATRTSSDPDAILESVRAFFAERLDALVAAGVARERIVLDPGMGFFLGDTPEPSLRLLRELSQLRTRFDCPVLVSVSRKSFLGALTGRAVAERGAASLAAELWAVDHGADWIRTHDVRALRDALRVREALAAES